MKPLTEKPERLLKTSDFAETYRGISLSDVIYPGALADLTGVLLASRMNQIAASAGVKEMSCKRRHLGVLG